MKSYVNPSLHFNVQWKQIQFNIWLVKYNGKCTCIKNMVLNWEVGNHGSPKQTLHRSLSWCHLCRHQRRRSLSWGQPPVPLLIQCSKYLGEDWWFFYAVYIGSISYFLQMFRSSCVEHPTRSLFNPPFQQKIELTLLSVGWKTHLFP